MEKPTSDSTSIPEVTIPEESIPEQPVPEIPSIEQTIPEIPSIEEPDYKKMYEENQFFSDQTQFNATIFQGFRIILDKFTEMNTKIDGLIKGLTIPGVPTAGQPAPVKSNQPTPVPDTKSTPVPTNYGLD